jgi:hypothetical protein
MKHTLVDDIPASARSFISTSDSLDMVIHDADQSCVVEATSGNPLRELAVPDESVAMNLLLVGFGIIPNGICTIKGVDSSSRLC